jgi:uncharacterized membrane-anchored protein
MSENMDAQGVVWFVIAAIAAGMAIRLLYQRYISKQASAVQSRGGTTLFALCLILFSIFAIAVGLVSVL